MKGTILIDVRKDFDRFSHLKVVFQGYWCVRLFLTVVVSAQDELPPPSIPNGLPSLFTFNCQWLSFSWVLLQPPAAELVESNESKYSSCKMPIHFRVLSRKVHVGNLWNSLSTYWPLFDQPIKTLVKCQSIVYPRPWKGSVSKMPILSK